MSLRIYLDVTSPDRFDTYHLGGKTYVSKPGAEGRIPYPKPVFDEVRGDIIKMSLLKVDGVALHKTGSRYRGVIDSGGVMHRFTLGGDGFFLHDVPLGEVDQARDEYHRLLDLENRASLAQVRRCT